MAGAGSAHFKEKAHHATHFGSYLGADADWCGMGVDLSVDENRRVGRLSQFWHYFLELGDSVCGSSRDCAFAGAGLATTRRGDYAISIRGFGGHGHAQCGDLYGGGTSACRRDCSVHGDHSDCGLSDGDCGGAGAAEYAALFGAAVGVSGSVADCAAGCQLTRPGAVDFHHLGAGVCAVLRHRRRRAWPDRAGGAGSGAVDAGGVYFFGLLEPADCVDHRHVYLAAAYVWDGGLGGGAVGLGQCGGLCRLRLDHRARWGGVCRASQLYRDGFQYCLVDASAGGAVFGLGLGGDGGYFRRAFPDAASAKCSKRDNGRQRPSSIGLAKLGKWCTRTG